MRETDLFYFVTVLVNDNNLDVEVAAARICDRVPGVASLGVIIVDWDGRDCDGIGREDPRYGLQLTSEDILKGGNTPKGAARALNPRPS